MSKSSDKSTQRIEAEIVERFGNVPTFFLLAMQTPDVAEDLWQQTRTAYLENPIPFAFKERLFVYLSRFCRVNYCVGRHAALLLSPAEASGARDAGKLTANEVVSLLKRAVPDHEETRRAIQTLRSAEQPLADWPTGDDGSHVRQSVERVTSEAIFVCGIAIFLRHDLADDCRDAVRQALSPPWYHRLEMFLSFVRRAHDWTEAHREIELEPDIQKLIEEHRELADWLAGFHHELDPHLASQLRTMAVQREQSLTDLRREQALLEGIINGLPDALILADLDRRITFCNPAVERMFGYPPEELIGQSADMLYGDPEDFQRFGKERFHCQAGENHQPMRVNWRRKSGEVFLGEAVGTIIRDHNAKPVTFLGMIRDVSHQEHMQAERERYFNVIEAISNGTPLAGLLDLVVTQAQDARPGMVASVLLLDEDGLHLRCAVAPQLPEIFSKAIDGLVIGPGVGACGAAVYSGRRVIMEDIHRDFRWEDYRDIAAAAGLRSCWSQPIVSLAGEVVGALAMYFGEPKVPGEDDLLLLEHSAMLAGIAIERTRTFQELAESEERLRMATRSTNDAIWDWDIAAGRFWINESHREMFGGPSDGEDPGEWWLALVHPDDRSRMSKVQKHLLQANEGSEVRWEHEYRLRKLDGNYAIVRDRAIRSVNEHGSLTRVLGAITNITQQRALEREVLDIAAEESWRIGSDLHDGVGQELTGMGMMTDALLTALARSDSPTATADPIKMARKIADSISRTLQQVRALARGMNPVDVDREGLMSSLSDLCDRVQELHGVDCQFECDQPMFCHDNQTATQLYRIAQEATANAIKHGHASQVWIRLAAGEHEASLRIIDNGRGLPEDSSDQDSSKRGGMGRRTMGYRAGLIGGQVTLGSHPGGGTEVACLFPRDAIETPLPRSRSPLGLTANKCQKLL